MDVKKAIETRRAFRSLEAADITTDLIHDLAKYAALAPSCFNKQPWRFVFVNDKTVLSSLHAALATGNEWVQNASLIVAVCTKTELDCDIKGRHYALFDTGMATAFMIMRATELNLVAHPIAGFDEGTVKEILNIPPDMQNITLVNIGKHANEIVPQMTEKQIEWEEARPERYSFNQFAYMNAYGKE